MAVYNHLGKYLRECRVKKGLTQFEVGNKLKLHAQFVSNWERGVCAPPNHSLHTLVALLGASKEKLVEVMLKDSKVQIEAKVYSRKSKTA